MSLKSLTITSATVTSLANGAFNGLSVSGSLAIQGVSITALQAGTFSNVNVGDVLSVDSCTLLLSIATGAFTSVTIGTELEVKGCTLLAAINAGAFAGLQAPLLTLRDNAVLQLLPGALSGLGVIGTVHITGNAAMLALPTDLFAPTPPSTLSSLIVEACPALATIQTGSFGNATIGEVAIQSNPVLAAIAIGAFAGGQITNLQIRDNVLLTGLVLGSFSGLQVPGSLSLSGNKLTALPVGFACGLTVGTLVLQDDLLTTLLPFQFGSVNATNIELQLPALVSVQAQAFKDATAANVTIVEPGLERVGTSVTGSTLHIGALACSQVRALAVTGSAVPSCSGGEALIAAGLSTNLTTDGSAMVAVQGPLCRDASDSYSMPSCLPRLVCTGIAICGDGVVAESETCDDGNLDPFDGCLVTCTGNCQGGITNTTDSDGDGVPDCQDGCPQDSAKLLPGICGCGLSDADTDGDLALDNCASGATAQDGCPSDILKTQPGLCGCGVTDVDLDGDGYLDNCASGGKVQDACPTNAAKFEAGACGCLLLDIDVDGDGYLDNCANGTVPQDACPTNAAKFEAGECGCLLLDVDLDGDGYLDNCASNGKAQDACPTNAAKYEAGACGCLLPDTDTDGDGHLDLCANGTLAIDLCTSDPLKILPGICGCNTTDTDSDGDGYLDNCVSGVNVMDLCPNDADKFLPGVCGCGLTDADSDGDGHLDDCDVGVLVQDQCPNDASKFLPGICGCGTSDSDTDGDGHLDHCANGAVAQDQCVNDGDKSEPGICGCGNSDADSDGDGHLDACANGSTAQDGCPSDAAKVVAGICGCGSSDVDSDGDGFLDNCADGSTAQDGCPSDASKSAAGTCGCGVSDVDSDGDGFLDNCADGLLKPQDGCPNDAAKSSAGLCGCGVADPLVGSACSAVGVLGAAMDSEFTAITLTFSGDMVQTPTVCAIAFSATSLLELGVGATCEWASASQFKVSLGAAATATNGTNLTLLPAFSSLSLAPVTVSTVQVFAAAYPSMPSASVVGPASVGSCADATFTAIGGVNPAGRGLQLQWSITATVPSHVTAAISAYTTAANLLGSSSITLPGALLQVGGVYTLAAAATDFLGRTSSAASVTFTATSDIVPSLSLDTGSQVTSHKASRPLVITSAVAWSSNCSLLAVPPAVTFAWTQISGPALGVQPVLALPSLVLAAGAMAAGQGYSFRCTATTATGSSVTADVTVSGITAAPLLAVIGGGQQRTVAASAVLALDASGSVNPNSLVGLAGATFAWQCFVAAGMGPCPLSAAAATALAANSAVLSLPAGSFTITSHTDVIMRLTLTVGPLSATVDQAITVLAVTEPISLASTAGVRGATGALAPLGGGVGVGARVEVSVDVQGLADSLGRRLVAASAAVAWTVVAGGVDLSSATRLNNGATLLIPHSALNPLQALVMRAAVTFTTSSGQVTLTSTVQVAPLGAPPRLGSLAVAAGPTSGSLALTAANWVDDLADLPLTYTYLSAPGDARNRSAAWWLGMDANSSAASGADGAVVLQADTLLPTCATLELPKPAGYSHSTLAVVVRGQDGQAAVASALFTHSAAVPDPASVLQSASQLASQGNTVLAKAVLSSSLQIIASQPVLGAANVAAAKASLQSAASLVTSLASASNLADPQQSRQLTGLLASLTATPALLTPTALASSLSALESLAAAAEAGTSLAGVNATAATLLPSTVLSAVRAVGQCATAESLLGNTVASVTSGQRSVQLMTRMLSLAVSSTLPGEPALQLVNADTSVFVQRLLPSQASSMTLAVGGSTITLPQAFFAVPAIASLAAVDLQLVQWRGNIHGNASAVPGVIGTGTLSVTLMNSASGTAVNVSGLATAEQPVLQLLSHAGIAASYGEGDDISGTCSGAGNVPLSACDTALGFRLVQECSEAGTSYISSCPATFKPPRCMYWHVARGEWSDEGCAVAWASNSSIACQCSHFTDFGGLFSDRVTRVEAVLDADITAEAVLRSWKVIAVLAIVLGCCFTGVSTCTCLSWKKARQVRVRDQLRGSVGPSAGDSSDEEGQHVLVKKGSVVMEELYEAGFRDSKDDKDIVGKRVGLGKYCCTLCRRIRENHKQKHIWLRIACERGPKARPKAESILMLSVVLLSNMMLLALRFRTDGSVEPDLSFNGLLFQAIETAVLSTIIRFTLIFLLQMGRPLPPADMHPADDKVVELAVKGWATTAKAKVAVRQHRNSLVRTFTASSRMLLAHTAANAQSFWRRFGSHRALQMEQTANSQPLERGSSGSASDFGVEDTLLPGTIAIQDETEAEAEAAGSAGASRRRSAANRRKQRSANAWSQAVTKASAAMPVTAVAAQTSPRPAGSDRGEGSGATGAAADRLFVKSPLPDDAPPPPPPPPQEESKEVRVDVAEKPRDARPQLPGVELLTKSERYIISRISSMGMLQRVLSRALLLPKRREEAARKRSARCRAIYTFAGYSLGALYCLSCAAFCWLFSIAFDGPVADAWLLSWFVAAAIGAIIIQPMILTIAAIIKHSVVLSFANVLASHMIGN